MKKHRSSNAAKKAISFVLSAALLMGSLTSTAFAGVRVNGTAVAEARGTESTGYESAPVLTCKTPLVGVENDGRSVNLELWLTLPEEQIKSRIHRKDVMLGGAFKEMIVSSLKHDRKTIIMDLVGVPDLTRENWNVPLRGTLELPGRLFGSDEAVMTSVEVQEIPGTYEEPAPRFQTYIDTLFDSGDVTNIHIILFPASGSFAEDLDEDCVSFGYDLKGGVISGFEADENGNYELTVSVPKKEREDGSFYGSVILSENSMADSTGELYPYRLGSFGEYSEMATGKDMTQNDIKQMKEIVGGFGNTTAGTIGALLSAGGSAFSAAYTVLGFAGVAPSDTSRHKAIMEKLEKIQDTLNEVRQETRYMSGVLKKHTQMLNGLGLTINEMYVGDVDGKLEQMITIMDQIDKALKSPMKKRKIEAAIEKVVDAYKEAYGEVGRSFEEADVEFDDLSEYYEIEAEFDAEEGAFPEEAIAGEADIYDDAEFSFDDAEGSYEGEAVFEAFDDAAFDDFYDGDFGDVENAEEMEEAVEVEEEDGAMEVEGDEALAGEELLSDAEEPFLAEDLMYALDENEVPLAAILETVGLPTEVESVLVSDETLLTASQDENGEWIVSRLAPFESEEWIRVTINGSEYEITVSDVVIISDEMLPEEEELSELPFEQSQIVDNIEVTVRAEAGVFPADAVLSVEKVSGALEEKANEAVEMAREEEATAAVSYTFDIKVLDSFGNEVQPSDGAPVEVGFALAEAGNPDLSANVYHMIEEEGSEELFAEKLDSEVDEQEESVTVESESFSLYTVEFTEELEETIEDFDIKLTEEEISDFLDDVCIEIGKIETSGGNTFSSLISQLNLLYPDVYSRFKQNNGANPINVYCSIHSITDNFATTSLEAKEIYAEEWKYQLIRAVTLLQALDSPSVHQDQIETLNELFDRKNDPENKGWPDVRAGAIDGYGNPYCYLVGDYVRLANRDEIWDLWAPLRKHDSKNYRVFIDDNSKEHISADEFVHRMNGRSLQEELELAGIVNLKDVRNQYFESSGGIYSGDRYPIMGLAFEFDRWGMKYGDRTFRKEDEVPGLARYRNEGPSTYSKYWFFEDKDYIIVSPEFILWDMNKTNYTGNEDRCYCPGGSVNVHYVSEGSAGAKHSYHEFYIPLTYLVRVGVKGVSK